MVRTMHRFMRRYRKAGLAFLAVFAIQVMAAGFCAIPSAHAAPATAHATMNMQCTMDMPMPAGQDMPECSHCKTPDLSTFANQTSDVSPTWALVAVLPTLLYQTSLTPEQEQPLFIASEAPPRSTSLIYHKTLRIRL